MDRIPQHLLAITNLYSDYDLAVTLGGDEGAGHAGFSREIPAHTPDRPDAKGLWNFDVMEVVDSSRIHIRHSDYFGQTVGWWEWLIDQEPTGHLISSAISMSASKTAFVTTLQTMHDDGTIYGKPLASGQSSGAASTVIFPSGTHDISPTGFTTRRSSASASPQPPQLDGVDLTGSTGSSSSMLSQSLRQEHDDASVQTLEESQDIVTVVQGEYFIAEAIGAFDPDPEGYILRADFYRDVNNDGQPGGDEEFLGSDVFPGGGWRVAAYTSDWAIGLHDVLCQVIDDAGHASVVRVATVEVVEPGLPPSVLPIALDPGIDPRYSILPHRNGDVTYDPTHYSLIPGQLDLWEITPQNGGGFTFTTTGSIDTVLGLYDWTTGELLAFDEDNGSGSNAELIQTLEADHTYVLGIGSQRGSVGSYGLEVTGINQTLTATLNTPSPLYSASVAETIDATHELDYYRLTVPTDANRLDVQLEVSSTLDGLVRVENASGETIATQFLGGVGEDDVCPNITVTAGEELFVTVAAMGGTLGDYVLKVDFNPDDPGLPEMLAPVPLTTPIVPLPSGAGMLDDQLIASPGEFKYYLLTVRQDQGGEHTLETFGDLDTHIGVYRWLSELQAVKEVENDDGGSTGNSRLTVDLTAGDEYVVVVRAEGNTTGSFSLQLDGPAGAIRSVPVSGLALTATTDYVSINNTNHFFYFRATAPETATSLSLSSERALLSDSLDVSLRLTDAEGNVLGYADSQGPSGNEQLANVAVEPGAEYFVTVYGQDLSLGDVRLTLDFSPDFPVTSDNEFPVNSTFTFDQAYADVAMNSNGQAVMVWDNHYYYRIDGQRFDANGLPTGGEFSVNSTATVGITHPHVAMDGAGRFVVVWSDEGTTYARVFNSDGTPIVPQFDVGFGYNAQSEVAMQPDGTFMVIGCVNGILYGRIYNRSGGALTGPLLVDHTADMINDPSVAADGLGRFIVTWTSISTDGNVLDVYAIRLDNLGNPVPSGTSHYVQGRVWGRRFDDTNSNGIQDVGESGLANITVILDANGNGVQDIGEPTAVTDTNGEYSFDSVPEGIYHVASLAGGPSGPAILADDFDRPDSQGLGADWSIASGDFRVEDGLARSQVGGWSEAVYEAFHGTQQSVTFDLFYPPGEPERSVYGAAYLAYADPSHNLQIRLADRATDGQKMFTDVYFEDGAGNTLQAWPRMSGGDQHMEIAPFESARILAAYDPTSRTVTLGIDRDFDGVFETMLTRGGVLPDGLGEQVGIGGYDNVAIDNFVVDTGFHVVPPVTAVPGEEFRVAPQQETRQREPAVGAHVDGTFVIVFESEETDGSGRNVYVQRFSSDGAPNGPLSLVHTNVTGDQTNPDVAVLSQGKYFVTWTTMDTNGLGVDAQQFGTHGERIGPEFVLNQQMTGDQQLASVASDGACQTMAAWQSTGQDTDGQGIFARRISMEQIVEPELTVDNSIGAPSNRYVEFGEFRSIESGGTDSITICNDGTSRSSATKWRFTGPMLRPSH